MTIEQILEIIERYKLRIPPTVYYELLADVREVEEEQEPRIFKWCTDCREYDQEKHCCHRWSKVIRNTVEEMKQEYIEREVLDKIRAELYATAEMHDDGDYYLREGWIGEIFDKYKTETEE